jgi:hypothetical protein
MAPVLALTAFVMRSIPSPQVLPEQVLGNSFFYSFQFSEIPPLNGV